MACGIRPSWLAAFDRMLDPLPVRRPDQLLHDGKRVHVVEAGGLVRAAVFLHGTNTNVLVVLFRSSRT